MAGDPVSEAELEEHRCRRPAVPERDQPPAVEPGLDPGHGEPDRRREQDDHRQRAELVRGAVADPRLEQADTGGPGGDRDHQQQEPDGRAGPWWEYSPQRSRDGLRRMPPRSTP